jgi:hypothetical protein
LVVSVPQQTWFGGQSACDEQLTGVPVHVADWQVAVVVRTAVVRQQISPLGQWLDCPDCGQTGPGRAASAASPPSVIASLAPSSPEPLDESSLPPESLPGPRDSLSGVASNPPPLELPPPEPLLVGPPS